MGYEPIGYCYFSFSNVVMGCGKLCGMWEIQGMTITFGNTFAEVDKYRF